MSAVPLGVRRLPHRGAGLRASRPELDMAAGIAQLSGAEVLTNEPLARSPLLERLLLDVVRRGDSQRPALAFHLRTRPHSLALVATRAPTGAVGITPRSWPGLGSAFAAYPDIAALHRAAQEMGLAEGSYGVAAMPAAKRFAWAASLDVGVVLGVFEAVADGLGKPSYVPFTVKQLRSLTFGA
jgi:hypothetical protein